MAKTKRLYRPYRQVTGKHTAGGGYIAHGIQYMAASIRPTRAAAGMTYTAARAKTSGPMSDEARRLSIWGTLVPRGGFGKGRTVQVREPCPCCGATRVLRRVTPAGRAWMKAQRRARADRMVARIHEVAA